MGQAAQSLVAENGHYWKPRPGAGVFFWVKPFIPEPPLVLVRKLFQACIQTDPAPAHDHRYERARTTVPDPPAGERSFAQAHIRQVTGKSKGKGRETGKPPDQSASRPEARFRAPKACQADTHVGKTEPDVLKGYKSDRYLRTERKMLVRGGRAYRDDPQTRRGGLPLRYVPPMGIGAIHERQLPDGRFRGRAKRWAHPVVGRGGKGVLHPMRIEPVLPSLWQ